MAGKKIRYIVSAILALAILGINIAYYRETKWFIPLIVVAVTVAWFQYWMSYFLETRRQKEIESKFPEFVRNLAGAIKSGMPVGKAMLHVSSTDYGALTPYVTKMAHQTEWAIPIHKILINFANETRNKIIKRAVSTVIEAEQSGGSIEDVLESITNSLIEIKKIKEERRASIHGQLIQSYIIFFVFLAVMIVIQNMLVPYIVGMQESASQGLFGTAPVGATGLEGMVKDIDVDFSSIPMFIETMGQWLTSLNGIFLMLATIQGFFAGVVIGKLSEGELRAGIKHSLILMTVAFFVITLAQGAM
ncbi:hypothetical protein GF351_02575 [Candidatus Woesearchaeota archaeon]|nr:hypothetical protein [Candidatus Woesearchaeota archaeon]